MLSHFRFVADLSRFCSTGDGWLARQIPPFKGGLFVAPNHHPEPGFQGLICRRLLAFIRQAQGFRQFSDAAPACYKSKQRFVAFVAARDLSRFCSGFVAR